MTVKGYERQHLAAFAAGFINDAGTTQVNFGCALTRISAGVYDVILPDDAGLEDRQTFTFVTIKGTTGPFYKSVTDLALRQKRVSIFNDGASPADSDIEVVLFRTVNPGAT